MHACYERSSLLQGDHEIEHSNIGTHKKPNACSNHLSGDTSTQHIDQSYLASAHWTQTPLGTSGSITMHSLSQLQRLAISALQDLQRNKWYHTKTLIRCYARRCRQRCFSWTNILSFLTAVSKNCHKYITWCRTYSQDHVQWWSGNGSQQVGLGKPPHSFFFLTVLNKHI